MNPSPHPCSVALAALPSAETGSRRRRLWELGAHAHCPVVGVCLPVAVLRKLAGRVLGGEVLAGDYELHVGAVADSKQRTPLAEALQRTLDERFAGALRQAAACKSIDALAHWWQQHSAGAGLPAALWAVITHPRCVPALEEDVLEQVHMRQHEAGHAERVDLQRLDALVRDNERLNDALRQAGMRAAAQAAEHAREIEAARAEAVRLRGQLLARDALLGKLQDELDAAQAHGAASLREQLRARGDELRTLQTALKRAHQQLQTTAARAVAAEPSAAASHDDAAPAAAAHITPAALSDRAVLCVGGRSSAVPLYRRLVEDCGARFVHHDGGDEDNVQRLQACLTAADLVICQAGCVSHDAYWRVKDHCKRTGTRCVFVDKPSAARLRRALASLAS
jgi:hypothetical protein